MGLNDDLKSIKKGTTFLKIRFDLKYICHDP